MEVLFCEIDGRVLGGMQFRVGGAALPDREGACSFGWEEPLCETDGWVLGGMQFAVLIKALVPVLFKALMDSGAVWGAV